MDCASQNLNAEILTPGTSEFGDRAFKAVIRVKVKLLWWALIQYDLYP